LAGVLAIRPLFFKIKQAAAVLQRDKEELEIKVAERTEEVARANEDLRQKIEERGVAEMAVEAERQRLFALLDGLPAMVYLKTPDFSLRFANRVFQEMVDKTDWHGKRCFEAILGRQEPCEDCQTARVFETGIPNESEWTNPFTDQTFQIHNYPFIDVDGSSLVLTLGFDITRRREAEKALRQSESRLAEAQRIARLGHWEWDFQSGEVIWSEEVFRIFGLTPGEFTPSLEAILNFVHPGDKERVSQGFSDTLAEGKPYNLVSRFVRPDGSVRYVHSQVEAVFDANGKPRRLLGTAQDITERRKAEMRLRASEERFRAIFEGAAMGIGVTDMQGRFLTANKTLQEMLGCGLDEIQGKTCLDFTHVDDWEKSRKIFQEMESGQQDRFQIEKRFIRKEGQYFWVRVTISLVRNAEGRLLYSIGMVEDITLAKEAGERLQESEIKLRNLASQLLTAQEDERRRISRELHDELGQGLLVLKLQAKSIENGLQTEQQQSLNECREMRANLDQVVDNVRRLSRDLSPTMLEDLGLSAAVHRLIRDFSRHYPIEYRLQETDINDLFQMEAQVTIYRLIQECLTNIGKHSQASLLTVAINKTHDRVSFIIQDNGRGFNPAQRRYPATDQGMGLAAMEERARMVGGALSIWSQEGAGTRVAFDIPYTPKSEE
jgi:PAS domain S-box-containing protein